MWKECVTNGGSGRAGDTDGRVSVPAPSHYYMNFIICSFLQKAWWDSQ